MKNLQALLIGENVEIMIGVISLLNRVNFAVDVITNRNILKKNKQIREFSFFENRSLVAKIASEKNIKNYSLIIIADDIILNNIVNSDLSIEEKLKLLPIQAEEDFKHISSKIGLSTALKKHGVNTPDFSTAKEKSELEESVKKIGYPVLIKIDASCGGFGVFECSNDDDLKILLKDIDKYPVLIQKPIQGIELDLSGFYQDGKLVHFSYSKVERVCFNKFGPSALRNYVPIGHLQKDIFDELTLLGKAIGAHGFVNISCIQSEQDNKRYFFEADMRPNVWVDFPKYFGNDPATHIAKYFSSGNTLNYPYPINPAYGEKILLPFFLRVSLWELALNRYNVWRYVPRNNALIAVYLMIRKIKVLMICSLKPHMPAKYWLKLKYIYQQSRSCLFGKFI
jgi:hypothetical protein